MTHSRHYLSGWRYSHQLYSSIRLKEMAFHLSPCSVHLCVCPTRGLPQINSCLLTHQRHSVLASLHHTFGSERDEHNFGLKRSRDQRISTHSMCLTRPAHSRDQIHTKMKLGRNSASNLESRGHSTEPTPSLINSQSCWTRNAKYSYAEPR